MPKPAASSKAFEPEFSQALIPIFAEKIVFNHVRA